MDKWKHEGWLMKKSTGFMGGWNKRYFRTGMALAQGVLRYYEHPDDEGHPKACGFACQTGGEMSPVPPLRAVAPHVK